MLCTSSHAFGVGGVASEMKSMLCQIGWRGFNVVGWLLLAAVTCKGGMASGRWFWCSKSRGSRSVLLMGHRTSSEGVTVTTLIDQIYGQIVGR